MASRNDKKLTSNIFNDGEDLNNGKASHLPQRSGGAQSIKTTHNDLSCHSSSSCDEEDGKTCDYCGCSGGGCWGGDDVETCVPYQCDVKHDFCNSCATKDECPVHPGYLRK